METITSWQFGTLAASALLLVTTVNAEISGSGSPHGACPGQIGDLVWQDLNGNGMQDAGEPGIADVRIRLYREDDDDNAYLTDTSDTTGYYRFYNLCLDKFLVEVDESSLPVGLRPTDDDAPDEARGVLDSDADDDEMIEVELDENSPANLSVDFGYRREVCDNHIGDRVWLDLNADGVQDNGESGIFNVPLRLRNTGGEILETTRTDPAGGYRFDAICDGIYAVDVDRSNASVSHMAPSPYRAGDSPQSDSDGLPDGSPTPLVLAATATLHLDFGFAPQSCNASIGDRVFFDGNANGRQDPGDIGLAGATLILADAAGTELARAQSDAIGAYLFGGLCAGNYQVSVVPRTLPEDYLAAPVNVGDDVGDNDSAVSGEPVSVTLPLDNAIDSSVDFGFVSPCGAAIGDRVWSDDDGDGYQDSGESGIAGVEILLRDAQGRSIGLAASDANGYYGFTALCAGDYAVQVDASTLPAGAIPSPEGAALPAFDSNGEAPVWVTLPNGATVDADIDFGFVLGVECGLSLEAGCLPAAPPPEHYSCNKPVDALTLVWNGDEAVRVLAFKGKTDDELLAEFDVVLPGQEITVDGFAGSPNDVYYTIYAVDNGAWLGKSKFNLACDDDEMDGPEDCGTAQGNGKDNKNSRINDWLLEGMVDAGGELDCTVDASAAASSCQVQQSRSSCEDIDDVYSMTFAYTGGGCGASRHAQDDKFKCSGSMDDSAMARVEPEHGDHFWVSPGQLFTVARDGGDTKIRLNNDGGRETLEIHTSCSRPLAPGDVFGSLQLVAINGKGMGSDIAYVFNVANTGSADIDSVSLHPSNPPVQRGPLPAGTQATWLVPAYAMESGMRQLTVSGDPQSGCSAEANISLQLEAPPACAMQADASFDFHDKELRWPLKNDSPTRATISRISVSWPHGNKELKEIKLDGEKIFDKERDATDTTIETHELKPEARKRRLKAGEQKTLKIKFDKDASTNADAYRVTVEFAEGCAIEF